MCRRRDRLLIARSTVQYGQREQHAEGDARRHPNTEKEGRLEEEEGEDEEETDMELAWKLLENARLIYLEHFEATKENPDPEPLRKERALELASVYENLGDINQEQSNFEGAIEDATKALDQKILGKKKSPRV